MCVLPEKMQKLQYVNYAVILVVLIKAWIRMANGSTPYAVIGFQKYII
jgi:hypothetical protein